MRREILLRARGSWNDTILDPPLPNLTPRKTEGPQRELVKALAAQGFLLRTPKTLVGTPVAEIHVNVQPVSQVPAFLLRMESGYVVPENDDLKALRRYARVFTWDRKLSREHGFVCLPHPIDLPEQLVEYWPSAQERQVPFCLIASNKTLHRPSSMDLYVERHRIIRWFENHAPNDLHLYGRKWNLPMTTWTLRGGILRGLGKLGLARQHLRVYKGVAPCKGSVLRNTRFAFALENIEGLEGYLTEKLFDCIYEGCLPIYLGDPLVASRVPKDVYVSYRRGESLQDLYIRLLAMTRQEYRARQEAMREYLSSEELAGLSSSRFAQAISSSIAEAIKGEKRSVDGHGQATRQ